MAGEQFVSRPNYRGSFYHWAMANLGYHWILDHPTIDSPGKPGWHDAAMEAARHARVFEPQIAAVKDLAVTLEHLAEQL